MPPVCVSIDLEMTSARPENQEVIEIAAIKFHGERVLESWSTLVRPNGALPFNIQVLTGIDPTTLKRAPSLPDVANHLRTFLGDYPLVAHTVSSDVGCLRRQGVILENPQFDTFELATILLPQLPSYSLASLASHFGIDFPQQHRAAHDALVTKQLFLKLLEVANDLELGLIQEINRLLANHSWPLKGIFQEIEVAKSRNAFGSSIRQALAAKGGVDDTDLDLLLAPERVEEPLRAARTPQSIDPEGLVALLKPGGLLSQKLAGYEYREPQVKMLRAVTDTLNSGGKMVVEAGTGTGKALDVDTPIPTPSGWKRMGDLQEGDSVFDEMGHVCTVTVAWPVMDNRPCYEVVFSDGSVIVADAEHLWASYTRVDRKRDHRYNRTKGPNSQTYESGEAIVAARSERAAGEAGSTITIPRILAVVGRKHQGFVGGAAGGLPTLGPDTGGARLYGAETLLGRVVERPSRLARDQGDRSNSPYTVLTTEALRDSLVSSPGDFNHAVEVAGSVDCPSRDLPIDPYVLGIWLADGESRSSQITTADPDVFHRLGALGDRARELTARYLYSVFDEDGPGKNHWHSSLTRKLRDLGVFMNKHVPEMYVFASPEQRRALLAGLLDRDGTVSRTGEVQFRSTSRALALGFQELACSLGYRATVSESRANLNGKDRGPEWMVSFTTRDQVFRLERKQRLHEDRNHRFRPERHRFRYVVDVRPVASRPVRCISVDSPKHLYLAGKTFIPTHNSMAYLLPAISYATRNNERVVVSTNTINLQDQLILKDIPDLKNLLPVSFRATVVKGRTNYLCLQRLSGLRRRVDLSLAETLAVIKILVWLPNTSTGDQSELNLTDAERGVWSKLYAHPDICTPTTCRYARRGQCFLYRARARAEAAHVVVVNHALLLSDVVSASQILPTYSHLIVDEAHHLEDQATDQLGYVLQTRDVLGYLDDLVPASAGERRSGVLGELPHHFRGSRCPAEVQRRVEQLARDAILKVGEVRVAVDTFFVAVTGFMVQRSADNRGYELRVRLTPAARVQPAWSTVEVAWETLELRLIALQEEVSRLTNLLQDLEQYNLLEYDELLSQLASLLSFNDRLRTEGNALVSNPAKDRIYWITATNGGETSLHSVPLDVAPLLKSQLYADKRAVVLTSATLTAAGKFDYLKGRLGLEDADEVAVGSPFDFARSTMLVVPSDMPEPEQPLYQRTLHQTLQRLCLATEGRALVLFTSHAQLRAAWQAIHGPLAGQGILVLGHGVDGTPRRQLLNTFKTNPKTVLLGASSFWEGIDVVGEALSVLVITRLPFGVPTDPVISARSELFDDPFSQYSLPQAILKFRQGFGRLIRSQSDRGVVVILDRRVQSKSYGAQILKSLPTCRVKAATLNELPRVAKAWLEVSPAKSAT